ncbi:DNA gyrase inhibitor YacG [Sphingomicrobium astaxanthinifaciens]|uniref:DNA gyrase inhibitor YacG n=1 Tax=Sphingomicrobium astaxanthinifaciens TaxID=1227949 RepID=UPI001FCB3082|nr:DNA gyrase inhibitor YacG [Sphingomicrobium astaxanthinifaciens]MCJ7421372.1 DNA gyrase inhibitor YacG [Sphingomicrobium astaxanthinifaciens]
MSPKPPACPICAQPTAREFRPFCSRGCKDRDLLQWLGDGYRIPGPAVVQEGLDSEDEAR